MKKIILLLALLTLGVSHAGILLEPSVGFIISGNVQDDETGAAHDEYDYNSPTFAARIGFQMLGFMGGLEYNIASPSWDDQVTTTTVDVDFKQSNMGVFVGYNFPIMIRVWGAYYISSTAEVDSGASKGSEYKGSGQALGVGFTALPFVSLNLEYRMIAYDEFTNAVTAVTTKYNSQQGPNAKEIILSVSLPFELPI